MTQGAVWRGALLMKGSDPLKIRQLPRQRNYDPNTQLISARSIVDPITLRHVPRRHRAVFPGVPHHVTQRGNHREQVFFAAGDSEAYLDLLHTHGQRHGLTVYAYCLMPNHVHLVVVPSNTDGMMRGLQAVHSQYAQRVNRIRQLKGHLWQGRYYASALDSNHFLNAVRYVERNPVEAGLVVRAEDYPWSSAAAHCGIRRAEPLLAEAGSSSVLREIPNWSRWLAVHVPEDCRKLLQRNAKLGLPCGSTSFVAELEKLAGRDLQFRSWGGRRTHRRM